MVKVDAGSRQILETLKKSDGRSQLLIESLSIIRAIRGKRDSRRFVGTLPVGRRNLITNKKSK